MKIINFYDYYGTNLVFLVQFFYQAKNEKEFSICINMTEFQYYIIMEGISKTEEGFYEGITADYVAGIWESSSGEPFELKNPSLTIKQLKISGSKLSDQIDIMACTALIDMFEKTFKEDRKIFIIYEP